MRNLWKRLLAALYSFAVRRNEVLQRRSAAGSTLHLEGVSVVIEDRRGSVFAYIQTFVHTHNFGEEVNNI
jgi:hypothetical protein